MKRTKNIIVSNWFRRGYDEYTVVLQTMSSQQPDLALALAKLEIVEDMFINGNKANRRRIDFIVGADGAVTPAD